MLTVEAVNGIVVRAVEMLCDRTTSPDAGVKGQEIVDWLRANLEPDTFAELQGNESSVELGIGTAIDRCFPPHTDPEGTEAS